MTRLTLSNACLMEASGELGAKARERLHEHINKYPAALLEFELARADMALLNALPPVEMTEAQRKQMAGKIKVGIQQKLWRAKQEEQAKKRWKLVYRALAGVSGAAACLVIAGGVLLVKKQSDAAQVAKAQQMVDGYLAGDEPNMVDAQYADVTRGIDELSARTMATNAPAGSPAIMKLVSDLDVTAEDEMDFGPPGSQSL